MDPYLSDKKFLSIEEAMAALKKATDAWVTADEKKRMADLELNSCVNNMNKAQRDFDAAAEHAKRKAGVYGTDWYSKLNPGVATR